MTQALGGVNSIARWLRARPQLAAPDFSHPTLAGQGVMVLSAAPLTIEEWEAKYGPGAAEEA